ncbi:MAG: hypothetical protein IT317_03875 [Anaerolineales bacterium]|nr:hypothetical protein [Anaerolineales bacterium]
MDDYRRLLALQSIHRDHMREAQAERRSAWLLGRTRHEYIRLSRVWVLLSVLAVGLLLVWGH